MVINKLTASAFVNAESQSSKSASARYPFLIANLNVSYKSVGTPLLASEIASLYLMFPASDTVDIVISDVSEYKSVYPHSSSVAK